jgi:hypothetical protein
LRGSGASLAVRCKLALPHSTPCRAEGSGALHLTATKPLPHPRSLRGCRASPWRVGLAHPLSRWERDRGTASRSRLGADRAPGIGSEPLSTPLRGAVPRSSASLWGRVPARRGEPCNGRVPNAAHALDAAAPTPLTLELLGVRSRERLRSDARGRGRAPPHIRNERLHPLESSGRAGTTPQEIPGRHDRSGTIPRWLAPQ